LLIITKLAIKIFFNRYQPYPVVVVIKHELSMVLQFV